jgi:hypothetical protein
VLCVCARAYVCVSCVRVCVCACVRVCVCVCVCVQLDALRTGFHDVMEPAVLNNFTEAVRSDESDERERWTTRCLTTSPRR